MAEQLYRMLTRRDFVKGSALFLTSTSLLAACGGNDDPAPDAIATDPTPTSDVTDSDTDGSSEDEETGTDEATEEVAEEVPEAEGIPSVPRNRTLMLSFGGTEGRFVDHELWSMYVVGATHQTGLNLMYEPLAFYSAFTDEEIMWLAEEYEFNDDSTELLITTRSGVTWSDGEPFSAEDVAYTLNSLRDLGPEVRWGTDVNQFVEEAVAVEDNLVRIIFKIPAPRFFFFMSYKYGIGIYPVPKHIFEDKDWTNFTAFDLEQGWPVTTSAWKVVFSTPDQKILDRHDSWWGVNAGVADLPQVERIVYLPFLGETQAAQSLITDQVDSTLDLRPLTIERVLRENPNITTHTGNKSPYGYIDWWPTALYLNNEAEPWDDPDMRWAISYLINRDQVIDVALNGAGSPSQLPMPDYPGLRPFVDSISDLLEEYDTLEYNVEKADAIMEEKGYTKNNQGFWELNGETIELEIMGHAIFNDIGPIIVEQLRQGGIEAEYSQPPNRSDRLQKGDYTGALSGHGGSVSGDPYFTLRLFQSQSVLATGGQTNQTRFRNDEYDAIVDEMAITSRDDTEALMAQFREAMEIWLPNLPNVQIQEWYHRIGMNQTYWTGWPDENDPYVNGAFWALTFALILHRLEPAQ